MSISNPQDERGGKPHTVREMALEVYDLTIALNAAFARLQAEVKRRRAAGVSDVITMEQIDSAANTPARKNAQAQIERVLVEKPQPAVSS